MDNMELLRSSSLWKKDYQSGLEGFTLSAVVLLGKDEAIQSILPHYKTDAISKIDNVDRYDDRDDIRCNLMNAYGRLNDFIRKHLPDKFYLEGNQRVNLRDKIFREVIGNILVHREFSNAFPAKLIIERNHVSTENWNKPHGNGKIDPSNFSPFPKNPNIAKFFKEIGWVDELGSGIRNTSKYCNIYNDNGGNAEFIEGDIFKTIIPLPLFRLLKATIETKVFTKIEPDIITTLLNEALTESVVGGVVGDVVGGVVGGSVSDEVKIELVKIIIAIKESPGMKVSEMVKSIGKTKRTVERYIKILRELELITFIGTVRVGGYFLTEKIKTRLGL
jgi:ATP-dependent DNA helicase RecG